MEITLLGKMEKLFFATLKKKPAMLLFLLILLLPLLHYTQIEVLLLKDLKNGLNSIKRFSSCAAVRCVIPRKSAEPLRLRSRMLWLLGTRVILSKHATSTHLLSFPGNVYLTTLRSHSRKI